MFLPIHLLVLIFGFYPNEPVICQSKCTDVRGRAMKKEILDSSSFHTCGGASHFEHGTYSEGKFWNFCSIYCLSDHMWGSMRVGNSMEKYHSHCRSKAEFILPWHSQLKWIKTHRTACHWIVPNTTLPELPAIWRLLLLAIAHHQANRWSRVCECSRKPKASNEIMLSHSQQKQLQCSCLYCIYTATKGLSYSLKRAVMELNFSG